MNRGSATIRERRVRVRLLHIPLPPLSTALVFSEGISQADTQSVLFYNTLKGETYKYFP